MPPGRFAQVEKHGQSRQSCDATSGATTAHFEKAAGERRRVQRLDALTPLQGGASTSDRFAARRGCAEAMPVAPPSVARAWGSGTRRSDHAMTPRPSEGIPGSAQGRKGFVRSMGG